MCMYVCVCACVHGSVCAWVCVCMCACVHVCQKSLIKSVQIKEPNSNDLQLQPVLKRCVETHLSKLISKLNDIKLF